MEPIPALLCFLVAASGLGGPAPAAGAAGEAPAVLVAQGRLRGRRVPIPGAEEGSVEVFLGVPYAQPPVGSRRFSRPRPPQPWPESRDATADPPACLQDPEVGQILSDTFTNRKEKVPLRISEDCLYLNIFTPARSDRKEKLPVMVWIHGGGLALGAASTYDGSALAAFEKVVVVVIQYRLGILGFYSTGDDHARGNWGLLDQVAALQWIQENIASFGGDPGSVMLFGESAGGGCVSAHVLSPASKGLFHKAISQSGVALIGGFIQDHPEELAKNIAETAGCPASSSSEMVRCLKGKSENEILEVTLKMEFFKIQVDGRETDPLLPTAVLDGEFFPKSPEVLVEEKNFGTVPYMIGVNNHEAGWLIPNMMQFPDLTKGLGKEAVSPVLRSLRQFVGAAVDHEGFIAEEYLEDAKDPLQLRDRLLELVGDVSFVAPGIVTARAHRDAGHPVYFYEFQHRPSTQAGLRPDFVKADHGDEIGFVFGRPFLTGEGTEEEQLLSKTVMKYWANFARNGNPNGDGLVHWPIYNGKERYLEIDIQPKAAEKLREKQMVFWMETLPGKIAESKRGHGEL